MNVVYEQFLDMKLANDKPSYDSEPEKGLLFIFVFRLKFSNVRSHTV